MDRHINDPRYTIVCQRSFIAKDGSLSSSTTSAHRHVAVVTMGIDHWTVFFSLHRLDKLFAADRMLCTRGGVY